MTSKLKNQDIADICKEQFLQGKDPVAVSAALSPFSSGRACKQDTDYDYERTACEGRV